MPTPLRFWTRSTKPVLSLSKGGRQAIEGEIAMADKIKVKAKRTDRRVVLFETHPDHPNGEAWVAGNGREVEVSLTPTVQRLLTSGELVQVNEAAVAAP